MSERPQREWRFYLEDMMRCAERVQAYVAGLSAEEFRTSGLNYDATIRNLELIGEAANRTPDDIRAANPGIPWRDIIATRNMLIHGYFGIDDELLWNIVNDNIPPLLIQLRALKDRYA